MGQAQGRIPQGTRAQQLTVLAADLPIQAREWIGKARISGRADDDEPTFRVDVNSGDQLLQMNIEVIRDRARDMTLEKDREAYAGDGQRGHNRHDAPRDESKPKRVPPHSGGSGMR